MMTHDSRKQRFACSVSPHHLVVPFFLAELRVGRLSELESPDVFRVYPDLPRRISWKRHADGVHARHLYVRRLDRARRGFRHALESATHDTSDTHNTSDTSE